MADTQANEISGALPEWVEPEVVELNVAETEGFIGRGGDGSIWIDCTRS